MRLLLTLTLLFCFVPTAVNADMVDLPTVKIKALDKSTARTTTFEAKVGTTIQYGSVFIKVQSCRKSAPLDKPENAAFLQIWEVPLHATKSEWVFSGWMFSSSPALSAMDHAVYDIWVLDCLGDVQENQATKESTSDQEADNEDALEEVIESAVETDQNVTGTP